MSYISIAIDGPAGAGKSTISKALANLLGFVYVDTGAIYRTVGLFAVRAGVDTRDAQRVTSLLPRIKIEIQPSANAQRMFLNGEDVTGAIREHEISLAASNVSAINTVRAFLLDMQRSFAKSNNIIMDGRDIGTTVLPNATLKLFLTASPESRAERRYLELMLKGSDISYQQVFEDVTLRDRQDSTRAIAPLVPARDAIIIDTTGNTLEASISTVLSIVKENLKNVSV